MSASRWSAKGEYLHYDLGATNYTGGAILGLNAVGRLIFATLGNATTLLNGHLIRFGVKYHFKRATPIPLLAKY
jgi:hypothetical protein